MFSKRNFFATLILLPAVAAFAQDYTVTGSVRNSDGEPESYATIRVYNAADTIAPVAVGTSGDAGTFSLPLPQAGSYRLIISATGKKNIDTAIDLSKDSPKANLDNLTMSDMSMELGAVEVVAQRPLVSKEIDRIGYDVQADNESKTSSIQDILRKVPMVSVDADGTIKVNGSDNFKIYKNGRPNNNFTRNAKDIFKAIPASTIKKIEVITDPGAREDAEGSGPILNIVTLQSAAIKGVMGTVGLNMNSTDFMPSPYAMIMTQIDKVTLSVNGGTFFSGHRVYKGRSESVSRYEDSHNTMRSTSANDYKRSSGHGGWFSLEGSYDIDTCNLVTAELSAFSYDGKSPMYSSTSMEDAAGNTIYSFDSYTRNNKSGYLSLDGNINYQHSTHRKGETITLSYMISNNHSTSDSQQEYYNLVNPFFDYTAITSNNTADFMEHTGQLDWSRPINDNHKFDLGAKFIFRNNHSDGDRIYTGENEHNTPTDYTHRTSIGAAYFDWRSSFGKITLRGGLRYEFSRLTSKDKLTESNNFASNLSDWVPMAAVNYNIDDANTIKLSYNTRISRPDISTLNPTRNETPTSVSYGNPDLESSMTHTFSLNYNIIKRKINADVSLNYMFSNDGVNARNWVENDISYSTYGNIGKMRCLSLSGYMRWMITRTTSWMLNLGLQRNHYIYPGQDIELARWGGYCYTQLRQQLPRKWDVQLWGFSQLGGAGSVYSYSNFDARNISYSLSIGRSFLKEDRLQLRLNFNRPFGPYSTKWTTHTVNSGIEGSSTRFSYNRAAVILSCSYRFGSLNAYVKKTAHTVSNDDISSNRPSTSNEN